MILFSLYLWHLLLLYPMLDFQNQAGHDQTEEDSPNHLSCHPDLYNEIKLFKFFIFKYLSDNIFYNKEFLTRL